MAILSLLVTLSLAVSLATTWSAVRAAPTQKLFEMSNLVGPTAKSLLAGGGLSVCTEEMGTPGNPICFHAGRMPMATLVVALGIHLFSDHPMRVDLFKTVLLLAPLEMAIFVAWQRLPRHPFRQFAFAFLLLTPFGIAAFLADVANMQVEEGYSYSFLALAVALLLFEIRPATPRSLFYAAAFGLAIAALYLAKSAMAPAAIVLVIGYLLLERRTAPRAVVLILALAAPLGWALHQHHASGRYSIGTSLDGINLHKANNPAFLSHYPPPPGQAIDWYDSQLNRGLHFTDEWSYNDYHQRTAISYLFHHPRETLAAGARKFNVLFFSIHKIGSAESTGKKLVAETAGLLLFRMLLWTALAGAVFWIVRPTHELPDRQLQRVTGSIFVAVVAASAFPYIAGFAYTRHGSVLIYPAAMMCCRLLSQP
jgi:hypothetical protein